MLTQVTFGKGVGGSTSRAKEGEGVCDSARARKKASLTFESTATSLYRLMWCMIPWSVATVVPTEEQRTEGFFEIDSASSWDTLFQALTRFAHGITKKFSLSYALPVPHSNWQETCPTCWYGNYLSLCDEHCLQSRIVAGVRRLTAPSSRTRGIQ